MSSAVEKELVEATKLSAKRNEDRQAFLVRLVRATAELDEAGWGKLSTSSQTWYNDAADEMNVGKPITEPPGDSAPAPTRRAVAEPKQESSSNSVMLADLKPDMMVTVETSKGETLTGQVIEADEKTVTLSVAGDEITVRAANIKSISTPAAAPAAFQSRPAAEPPAAAQQPAAKRESKPAAPAAAAKPKGKSVTQRMRELICENLDADRAAVGKMLAGEGLTFSEATLDIMFSDTRKTIDCLIALGKLK